MPFLLVSPAISAAMLMPMHVPANQLLHTTAVMRPAAAPQQASAAVLPGGSALSTIFPAQLIADSGESMTTGKAKIEAAKRASDDKLSKRGYVHRKPKR